MFMRLCVYTAIKPSKPWIVCTVDILYTQHTPSPFWLVCVYVCCSFAAGSDQTLQQQLWPTMMISRTGICLLPPSALMADRVCFSQSLIMQIMQWVKESVQCLSARACAPPLAHRKGLVSVSSVDVFVNSNPYLSGIRFT